MGLTWWARKQAAEPKLLSRRHRRWLSREFPHSSAVAEVRNVSTSTGVMSPNDLLPKNGINW